MDNFFKTHKMILALLIVLMAVGLFAGCTSNTSDNSTGSTVGSTLNPSDPQATTNPTTATTNPTTATTDPTTGNTTNPSTEPSTEAPTNPTTLPTTSTPETNQPTTPPATQPPATQPPATQPPATQPPATQPPATQPTYETFTGKIGAYDAHNKAYKDWKGDTEQAAYIEVYTIEKSDRVLEDLAAEFEKVYGFAPSLGNKYKATSSCEKLGTYMVEGYDDPQVVYRYSITDKTYIYITNKMYTVYKQTTDDGKPWCGYCIYGTFEDYSGSNTAQLQALQEEMFETFAEMTGYDLAYMQQHKDTYALGWISDAGTVRTASGLADVLYIYCRVK